MTEREFIDTAVRDQAARAMLAALTELDEAYRDSDPDRWRRALKQRRIALNLAKAAGIKAEG